MKKIFFTFCLLLTFSSFFGQSSSLTSKITSIQSQSVSQDSITEVDTSLVPSPQLAMSTTDYPVTAGDIYTLAFAVGTTPISYTIPVDSTYRIRVANLAVLDVSGMTFLKLKRQVEEIVTKNYPLSGVQFVLMTPAVFNVTIVGEVKETEIKQAWALTKLSSIINNSYTAFSSNRNIEVTSTNGKKKTYDLFKAIRFGELSQDPYLKPGDIIKVGRIERKVTISGAVERPGTYELLDNENLKKLIEYYGGGLSFQADVSRTELNRIVDPTAVTGKKIYLSQVDFENDFILSCYDSITIPSYNDLKPVVFIEGALYANQTTTPESSTRIAISFIPGENYATFIRRNKNMFSAVSDTENSYIIRGTEQIPINIDNILYDVTYVSEQELNNNDTLMIPFRQYFITVAGAVVQPGRYPFIPDRDWSYYIGLAGGFTTQNTKDTIVIKTINGDELKKEDSLIPETTITAKHNSFLYFFNQYAPIITTILSILTSSISIFAIISK